MLPFEDLPYQFFSPKYTAFVHSIVRQVNRYIALPGKKHQIKTIQIEGGEYLEKLRGDKKARILFLSNHCTHSDPQVLTEVFRRCRIAPSFMAAYDVFLRSRLHTWVMRSCGCFSVDRDGNDRQSLRCAESLLLQKHGQVVLFPEGNVFYTNDSPAPFLDGAAFIASRAQRQLMKKGESLYIIPIGLKYSYLEDIREKLWKQLNDLASYFGEALDAGEDFTGLLRRIALQVLKRELEKHQHALPGTATPDFLPPLLEKSAALLIASLEKKLGLPASSASSSQDRIRAIRHQIHKRRIEDHTLTREGANILAEEAMLALRVLSYQGTYVSENPTIDRAAEVLQNLLEDVYSKETEPFSKRAVFVSFGSPLSMRNYFNQDQKTPLPKLTEIFEKKITSCIAEINQRNTHIGGKKYIN